MTQFSRWPAFTVLLLFVNIVKGQLFVRDSLKPGMEWHFRLIDLPFMKNAAIAEATHRNNGTAATAAPANVSAYSKFYSNLSMHQVTEMAHNLHGTAYYVNNQLWNKWIQPTTNRKYFWNRLAANLSGALADLLLTKLPYGYAYQHEEFHRSVLNVRGIYSFDEVWTFGKGLDIAVTNVKDEDLIYLKAKYPADMVRLAAAGVEGEYALLQQLREDNFFNDRAFPFIGLNLIGTIHGISYVNLPFSGRFNSITDSILSHDKFDIAARDFTGYDFSAWVYDLLRPQEVYEARGQWPGGIGIKRPVKESDLTGEMKDFLRQTGNMQYLNLITAFMFGINKMRLGEDAFFNFAMRSVPASFGYYAGLDLYFKNLQHQFSTSIGINKSDRLTLPAISFKYRNARLRGIPFIKSDLQLSFWLQPRDQYFYAEKSRPGFLLNWSPTIDISKRCGITADIEYKTRGWVFGNPYLSENFSGGLGFYYRAGT